MESSDEKLEARLETLARELDELRTRYIRTEMEKLELHEKMAARLNALTQAMMCTSEAVFTHDRFLYPEKYLDGAEPANFTAVRRSLKQLLH